MEPTFKICTASPPTCNKQQLTTALLKTRGEYATAANQIKWLGLVVTPCHDMKRSLFVRARAFSRAKAICSVS